MYKAIDVANWFICYNEYLRNVMNEDTDDMSNLRIQKLLFYTQSASMALSGKPFFAEEIKAWKHGPVVPEVYEEFKKFGSSGIPEYDQDKVDKIDKKDVWILKEVYNIFGEYSAWGLRNLTHSEYPWKSTELGDTISLEKMGKTFKEKYVADEE